MAQNYQATFIQEGLSIDYTPGSAVAAGQVVVQGSMIGAAKTPIAANALGALAVRGIFDVVKANEQQALGAALYWDADGNPYNGTAGMGCATTTSSGNTFIGFAMALAGATDEVVRVPLGIAYHDHEWGVPVHDDRRLFEFLVLEGAQAGLSWEMILKKREAYRLALEGFDPRAVAAFDRRRIQQLIGNAGIIRNRLKIESAVRNAKAFLEIQNQFGSFDAYVWRFVGGQPRVNRWRSFGQVPARTAQSDALSKDLKQRGFNFVGSTICYAFMQAVGMVNDHLLTCFRHGCSGLEASLATRANHSDDKSGRGLRTNHVSPASSQQK